VPRQPFRYKQCVTLHPTKFHLAKGIRRIAVLESSRVAGSQECRGRGRVSEHDVHAASSRHRAIAFVIQLLRGCAIGEAIEFNAVELHAAPMIGNHTPDEPCRICADCRSSRKNLHIRPPSRHGSSEWQIYSYPAQATYGAIGSINWGSALQQSEFSEHTE